MSSSYLASYNFQNSLEIILSPTNCNFNEFINEIPQIFTTNKLNPECREETNGENTHIFCNNFSTSSVSTSKDNAEEMILLKAKCEKLSAEVEHLTKEKENAFEEIEQLKDQILSQSTYCTSLGAVLGNLTWRASKFPQIVDTWISNCQSEIGEFLAIVNGTFSAFVSIYKFGFPPTSNVEYQFVKGLLGIATNITANPESREFLITNRNGTEFVQKIIKLTPELPPAPGSLSLKRLMLMIMYNVSINKTGLRYLFESRVGDTLSHCLEHESSSELMQLLCLRVLQSVTYDLTEPRYIRDLSAAIPIEKIETMVSSTSGDISNAAKQVLRHLQDSKKNLK
ncbi:heat shock factor 2-binding protein-like [Pseudomyrmex gracilis]|uniref:heat shock factor 2-binding protein-like n=1 Tax=Pseudomyrmex gracilis TaxID=219809 RepID=UPI000994F458|nr:heat shock factor 2-binding protein-like [Pseudomyrmex gracilis]